MKHTGQESGGELYEIFKFRSFLQSKYVKNVCKLFQLLPRRLPGLRTWSPGPDCPQNLSPGLGAMALKRNFLVPSAASPGFGAGARNEASSRRVRGAEFVERAKNEEGVSQLPADWRYSLCMTANLFNYQFFRHDFPSHWPQTTSQNTYLLFSHPARDCERDFLLLAKN